MVRGALRSRLGRHSALNFMGLATPLAVAFLLLPVLARALGPARFGLLGIAWAFLEYLTLFDAGLGRATTKFVADSLERGTADASQVTAVALTSQLAIGALVAAALWLLAPQVAARVVTESAALQREAAGVIRMVAVSLPVVLALTTLRGVLEGAREFGLVNAIRIPSSAANIVIPTIAAAFGASVPAMLVLVLAARVLTCFVLLAAILRAVPSFRVEPPREWRRLSALLSFGGWVMVSSIASPMLVYFDRFALTARAGLAAVGYYVPAFEAMSRTLLIPISVVVAMFPLVAGLTLRGERERVRQLFSRAMWTLFALMLPVTVVVLVFAPTILRVWMGETYAVQSALAMRVLAVGVLINAMAHPPYTFLEAAGRPDVPARFHLLELALFVPLAWFLVGSYGITGAAIAWTARVTFDSITLYIAATRLLPLARPARAPLQEPAT